MVVKLSGGQIDIIVRQGKEGHRGVGVLSSCELHSCGDKGQIVVRQSQ